MWLLVERGVAVWGIGDTKEEALGDANKWLIIEDTDSTLDLNDVDEPDAVPTEARPYVWVQASDRQGLEVGRYVDTYGGSLRDEGLRILVFDWRKVAPPRNQ
jgi:hypothetical protein